MKDSIQILLVEDNEHDQIAFKRALKDADFMPMVTVFESGQAALNHLEGESGYYDILVSDYDLPGINGLTLCQKVMTSKPDMALIILTGRGSENLAVEALKTGVDDYLTKDPGKGYLKLLPQVLTNCVKSRRDATARLAAEQALAKSEAGYKRLVENSPDIVYSFSSKRGGIYYSSSVEARLGYSPDHMLENPFLWSNSIHPDDSKLINDIVGSAGLGGKFSVEYRIVDAQGQWHWFWDRSIGREVLEDEIIIEGLATDITEQKNLLKQRDELIIQLQDSLDRVKKLSGLLPICSNCKKIRDDQGYWQQVEKFILSHSEAEFTHGICPDCKKELYPELYD